MTLRLNSEGATKEVSWLFSCLLIFLWILNEIVDPPLVTVSLEVKTTTRDEVRYARLGNRVVDRRPERQKIEVKDESSLI